MTLASPRTFRSALTLPSTTLILLIGVPAIFFAAYGVHGGMPWDYSLVVLSEDNPGWAGFLYPGDPLRKFTNLFYHFSFLLTKALGLQGDWLGYHAVSMLLLSAKGFLTWCLCRGLRLGNTIGMVAAAVTVLHGSDTSFGHVGQLNQSGIVFFSLLSMCCFLEALSRPGWRGALLLIVSAAASYLALWSHEATLFGLLAFPPLFVLLFRTCHSLWAWFAGVFVELPPLIYTYLMAERMFLRPSGASYQESVLRPDIANAAAVGSDYLRLLRGLLLPDLPSWNPLLLPSGLLASALILSAVLAFASRCHASQPFRWDAAFVSFLLASAFVLPYVAMKLTGQTYWRTLNLAVPFAAIFIAQTVVLLGSFNVLGRALAAAALGGMLLVGYSANAATYARYNEAWERIRAPVARSLRTAPDVAEGTIILWQDVPPGKDYWTSDFWFDHLVRLAYPGRNVHASYTLRSDPNDAAGLAIVQRNQGKSIAFPDGRTLFIPHSHFFRIEGRVLVAETAHPRLKSASLKSALVLGWSEAGPFRLIEDATDIRAATSPESSYYRPEERIRPTISPIAKRRFRVE
jgi:hypothetical protein